jgi:hypothetical protein
VARQLIGKVKLVNASGMVAEVPDQKPNKAEQNAQSLRRSMAKIPESGENKTQ